MKPETEAAGVPVLNATRELDRAVGALCEALQKIDENEPIVMAQLQKAYGLPQVADDIVSATSDLMTALGAFIKTLE